MFKLNPFKNSFGLDLSEDAIRLVKIDKKKKKLISLNEENIEPGIIEDGEIKEEKKLKKYISKLIEKPHGHKLRTKFVHCGIPERKTFIKLIEVNNRHKSSLSEAIKWEASQHIPFSPDKIYLDWNIIKTKNANNNASVLVGAAPKIIIDSYSKIINSVNLTPLSFEMESVATIRAIIAQNNKISQTTLVIDLGGNHTNLIIFDRNSIQFSSSLTFSGEKITKKIMEKLKINREDAEKLKILYGLEKKKGKGKIRKVIEPEFNKLTDKINEIESFYINHFPHSNKIKDIILCGGGSQLKYLPQLISHKTKKSTILANPLNYLNSDKKIKNIIKKNSPSFTTAIGLALK
ncbi:MAG: type IV pilus assembly protein PilM [Patescibacteria group bacterium]|nr:type IV pilus assembly protein PilM [Patescibacteria group bacterium]